MSGHGSIRIVEMPVLGAVSDDSSVVGEHAGSGRFTAPALRDYIVTGIEPELAAGFNNVGRNILHNGGFTIWQRGLGPWNTTNAYTADRWFMPFVGGTMQTQLYRQSPGGIVTTDERSEIVLGVVMTGSPGSSDYAQLVQRIEGVQRLAGQTVTLSFYANASAALKVGANLTQVFGTGGSPSAPVSLPGQSVTLTADATFNRYSMTFVVPSIVGKTYGTIPNSDFTQIAVWLSAGSVNDIVSGGIGVQSGSFNFWGLQLEYGDAMTPLERLEPSTDYQNCMRFYVAGNFMNWGAIGAGQSVATSIPLRVPMRAVPTVVPGTPTSNINLSSALIGGISPKELQFNAVGVAAGPYGYSNTYTASADL